MARPSRHQIDTLRRQMIERRDALLDATHDKLARWTEQPIGDIAGEVADPGDDSVASLITDLDHAEVQRRVDAVRDIDAALERIERDAYGVCIDCGTDLDYERLSAFPTAKRCVDCQTRHEKTYAHGETPTL